MTRIAAAHSLSAARLAEVSAFSTETVQQRTARIPAHTPEWTNLNESDPGITTPQAFAWLADALGYRIASGGSSLHHDTEWKYLSVRRF
jgi:hypothetical protein